MNTKKLLDAVYGPGNWSGLDTEDKMTCWRYGYDNPFERTGKFLNPDSAHEEFVPIKLGANGEQITDNDAYYVCLGQMAERVCLRCGHTWSITQKKLPGTCPKCKSPYWNKERMNHKLKQPFTCLECGHKLYMKSQKSVFCPECGDDMVEI